MPIVDFRTSKPPDPVDQLEAIIENERTRLLKADSLLGCLQIALDPEAVAVPAVYFPYVVEMAREQVAEALRHLEFFQLRQLVHEWVHGEKVP